MKIKNFKLFLESNAEISQELLERLQSKFKTGTSDFPALGNKKWISIDDKMLFIENNKKTIKQKIYNLIQDDFEDLTTAVIMKTIKKFLDSL